MSSIIETTCTTLGSRFIIHGRSLIPLPFVEDSVFDTKAGSSSMDASRILKQTTTTRNRTQNERIEPNDRR